MPNALESMLAQVATHDPELARRLRNEVEYTSRGVGLVWERHEPETVTLPGLKPRVGHRVMLLPPRGVNAEALRRSKKKVDRETVDPMWGTVWTLTRADKETGFAHLVSVDDNDDDVLTCEWPLEDVVSAANFIDPIYPGLKLTGEVRGTDESDAPEHVVINAENYHALQMLTYTHAGKIDAIYIDPPYNTGAKDWKYNNAFVDTDDKFRHSKWLSFMERRLEVAKKLLNPDNSVLIVTIDEKEYLNLGVLLRQMFPEARIQMISSVINPAGTPRKGEFSRVDEYVYILQFGNMSVQSLPMSSEWRNTKVENGAYGTKLWWLTFKRTGTSRSRAESPGCFYPVFIKNTEDGPVIHSIGSVVPMGVDKSSVVPPVGTVACFPVQPDGSDGRWQMTPESARSILAKGYMKLGKWKDERTSIQYLTKGEIAKVESGVYEIEGHNPDGSIIVGEPKVDHSFIPGTQWRIQAHDAMRHGTQLISALIGPSRFTFPKSLYAVEDVLRFFVKDKPEATILDFFAGSGTTAHAVMRLNKQDGGRRRSISVTNNEVSADEIEQLTKKKLRPGDAKWDELGIADYVTKPRIQAAITGKRASDGAPIKGDYKFTDEFPMADGFAANASFWTLTYEDVKYIEVGLAFERIAPLLWMQAGQSGRIITKVTPGFDIADTYAVLFDPDQMSRLARELGNGEHERVKHVFVVTDHEGWWQDVNEMFAPIVGKENVHRLYRSYLKNFEIEGGK